jgi:Ca-activated chloride channel homolog
VAIDTSRSMLATDVEPNRLERAKLAVLDLTRLLRGDRIGLVAFAGGAFLECPLTLDAAAFRESLHATEVGIIPRGGTAIGRAIDAALEGFESREGRHEALILISDGEDHAGNVDAAVKRAAAAGVKIYTVGIGTPDGELIPLGGRDGGGYVKDAEGRAVKSRLNEKTLTEIARETGGAYVRGTGSALGLDEIFREHLAGMEKRELESTIERRSESRFQIPLALALLALLIESWVGERTRAPLAWPARWRRSGVRGTAAPAPAGRPLSLPVLLLLPSFLAGPSNPAAQGNRHYYAGRYAEAAESYGQALVDQPGSPLLEFDLGTAELRQGKYAEAIASLDKALAGGDSALEASAAYNVGNAHYRLGASAEAKDPGAAIDSYRRALQSYERAMTADPADEDAKFNHEFVAKKLADLEKRLENEKKTAPERKPPDSHGQGQPPDSLPTPTAGRSRSQGAPQPTPGENELGERSAPQGKKPAPEPGGHEEAPGGGSDRAAARPKEEAGGSRDADRRAAQAILDTARGEELSPGDVRRDFGMPDAAPPREDW